MRQFSGNVPYSHFVVSEFMVDNRTFFSSKGIIQQAPLYLYPEEEKKSSNSKSSRKRNSGLSQMLMFEPAAVYKTRRPNIAEEVSNELESLYGKKPSPESILYYIYGILYSNFYRKKYFEFLKIDFPRVPLAKDYELFKEIGKLGGELIDLHLMKSKRLEQPIAKFQGMGENEFIERVIYNEKEKRIYINEEKYFDKVELNCWKYYIGGYQVLQKYLKDRKGRLMDDPPYYCRVITAIYYTILIQKKIDKIYPLLEN